MGRGLAAGRRVIMGALAVMIASMVLTACDGTTEVPKGDGKPPAPREGVPEPPSAKPK